MKEKIYLGMALVGCSAIFASLIGTFSSGTKLAACATGTVLFILAFVLSDKNGRTPQ